MKTLRVATLNARSYGAFEMKEFIGKSTIKSFGLTMGMLVLIPLVCIVVKASVAPTPPQTIPTITIIQPPIIPQTEVVPPPKVDVPPPIRGISPQSEGTFVPVEEDIESTSFNTDIIDVQAPVVDNGGNGGTATTDIPSSINVKTPDSKDVIDDDDTEIEVESDPVLNFAQLQANLVYPDVARRSGVEGKVLLRVVVGKDGKPVIGKVRVLDSSNELFNQAAIDAVLKSSFTPAIQNKQPIEVPVTVPIVFRLR